MMLLARCAHFAILYLSSHLVATMLTTTREEVNAFFDCISSEKRARAITSLFICICS